MGKIEKILVNNFSKYVLAIVAIILFGYFINSFKISSDYDKYISYLKIAQYNADLENIMIKEYFTAHRKLKEIDIDIQPFFNQPEKENPRNLAIIIKSVPFQRGIDRFGEYMQALPKEYQTVQVTYFSKSDTTLDSGTKISKLSEEDFVKFSLTTILVLDGQNNISDKIVMSLHHEEYIESMVSKFLLKALEHN